MTKYLWTFINKICPGENLPGVFLAINIIFWTTGTLIAGLLFCSFAGQISIGTCIARVMCISIYSGIIFGFFGGILFLMRRGN